MDLQTVFKDVPSIERWGNPGVGITSIEYDSRRVKPGALFFALPGAKVDGGAFIARAIEAGAAGIVAARAPETVRTDLGWVRVADPRAVLGRVAANFYGWPSRDLKVAGVTGTNGKTTTAFLVQHLNRAALRGCGLIGTVRHETGARVIDAANTTPESADLQSMLAEMRDHGCRAAVMEVSSIGLDQHRVNGVEFDVGIFTNLTRDHLDYHGTMEAYFQAKRKLLLHLAAQAEVAAKKPVMVINGDDPYGQRLLKDQFDGVKLVSFGFGARNDYRAANFHPGFEGTTFQLETGGRQILVRLPLIGRFNVANAVGALAAVQAMGLNLREAVAHLAEAPQVPGRMEDVGEKMPFRVFVDYAHTPDALEKACATLRELKPGRLITVFGCGGDRDRTKRPLMAETASRSSDLVILTSDNPRTEDPERILDDAAAGLRGGPAERITDRREAIRRAIGLAQPRDIVLIAGKGHETYQQIGETKFDFDDRQEARFAIRDLRYEI
ncbi:MAG: UDP-N-acetylmuramoyl-L-alanyl-D-glutamate--2,6-diaminopimelate ligase [Verrucomicrobia bacterium]|nr:UDP-N-acetylmuramoyl-L-alanyl-D-glutamate--2,6-diaminopimelate ligase [Verrucomicrobiota bacterium]